MDEQKHELIAQVKQLREKIVELVMEREDILLQKNPAIEADYMVKVGAYEVKLAEAELAARRAKRRLAICQAQANAGKNIKELEIEEELDAELEEWMVNIQQKQMQVFSLLDRRSSSYAMAATDSKKLKTLYRKLCKRLHPDLIPLLSDQEKNLFSGIQKAYERGDVTSLEAYLWVLDEAEDIDDERKDVEELTAEVALLEAQVSVQEEMLLQVKSSYPFNLLDKLSNANWVFETVQDLKRRTIEFENARQAYDVKTGEVIKHA